MIAAKISAAITSADHHDDALNSLALVAGLRAFAPAVTARPRIVLWSRAVATAILTGVVAKLIFFAPGDLASVPLGVRVGAAAVGFTAFLAVRRSVFVGVTTGEAILVGARLFYGS